MRRISFLFIVSAIIVNLLLVGCGKEAVSNKENSQEVITEQTDGLETVNNADVETGELQGIGVDKKLLTVDVTLPADLMGDLTDFSEDEYLSENDGVIAAKKNQDGSLTITMTKSKHTEMLEETRKGIDESFGELIEGEDTPYIKSIDYTNEYREVIVGVVREEYETAFDLTPLILGFSTSMYQSVAGLDIKTTIVINDISTGEEIGSVTYPDAWMEE
ncbi:hypothetical protein [Tissierella sp. Yu-01]|uniref:hypothetical protein n=1 Tax=Tissierella sp. Yu-01 TaxID=3035694 RepID=UPI00240D7532|nr:hypothetical protein [Tissierella sp. Yu-01]WFA07809.1 hypothetical protein P3962_08695 [Tissierella sp. Yu-01]